MGSSFSAEQLAIESTLREAGPRFAGADASWSAREWIEDGFDGTSVEGWVAIGVWDSGVAAWLRDAGLSPDQVRAGAETLMDALDEDTRRLIYTDSDPIYSACNGDTSVDVLIGAAMAVRPAD